ncbi:hypothetical protein CRG98_008036 [Punica granatum]|uniref:Uncharacterized protein n=1 Tax=Punica granatum TaxID=22663 RepID=A0A2I0KSS0_PUNGR|nr:hypothetical protein CRG98_008036 [Punica granatum]
MSLSRNNIPNFGLNQKNGRSDRIGQSEQCGSATRGVGPGVGPGVRRSGETGHAFQAEPEARRNGSDHLGWTRQSGLGRICWVGPAQTKKIGRASEKEDAEEDEDGWRKGFRRPRTAVPAARCRDDGTGGRRRRWRAPPRLCRARERRHEARIGWDREKFRFFWRGFSSFQRGISEFNHRKSRELRGGNRGVLLRGVSRVRSRGEIGARSRDFRAYPPIRESGAEREGPRVGGSEFERD